MPKIEIYTYSEIYNHDVINLILTIQQKEFEIPIDLEAQPDLKNIPGFYQRHNGNFWVATIDNIIVGTIALLDIGNNCAALRKMFVKAPFRGNKFGIGRSLLNTVFDWAVEKKINDLILGTTDKFGAAQRFYEKNGFKEIDKKLLPIEFPVMPVDTKFYKHTVLNDKKIQTIQTPESTDEVRQANYQCW